MIMNDLGAQMPAAVTIVPLQRDAPQKTADQGAFSLDLGTGGEQPAQTAPLTIPVTLTETLPGRTAATEDGQKALVLNRGASEKTATARAAPMALQVSDPAESQTTPSAKTTPLRGDAETQPPAAPKAPAMREVASKETTAIPPIAREGEPPTNVSVVPKSSPRTPDTQGDRVDPTNVAKRTDVSTPDLPKAPRSPGPPEPAVPTARVGQDAPRPGTPVTPTPDMSRPQPQAPRVAAEGPARTDVSPQSGTLPAAQKTVADAAPKVTSSPPLPPKPQPVAPPGPLPEIAAPKAREVTSTRPVPSERPIPKATLTPPGSAGAPMETARPAPAATLTRTSLPNIDGAPPPRQDTPINPQSPQTLTPATPPQQGTPVAPPLHTTTVAQGAPDVPRPVGLDQVRSDKTAPETPARDAKPDGPPARTLPPPPEAPRLVGLVPPPEAGASPPPRSETAFDLGGPPRFVDDISGLRADPTRVLFETPSRILETARSVQSQIVDAARQIADGTIEVRLSPEELGRVRLTVAQRDAEVTISVLAERSETLDLMRRHADALSSDLRQAGFDRLSFSFGQGSGEQASGDDRSALPRPELDTSEAGANKRPDPANPAPARAVAQGLDIRL